MRILVVEDEIKAGEYLRKGLNESGYIVDLARTGFDGKHMALSENYKLIVLDIMLPGMDGWQVLREVRSGKDTPVLCLTARDAVEERVKGLEFGADDYLVKPFAFAELLARVRTLLRRGPLRGEDLIQIADLEVDV
ncbi:MAG: response regulator, partial [Burkholderiales bacterium]|nr:response regulator [Burkholderiales bacterium]